jgi:predicted amidohydrolase
MRDYLRIALIQTKLDSNTAWDENEHSSVCMHYTEENRIWDEIKKGFCILKAEPDIHSPHIIILPELTLALSKEKQLESIAKKTGAVIIAGLDFIEDDHGVKNVAVVMIPNKWPDGISSGWVNKFYFGKAFFSYLEEEYFKKKHKVGQPCPNMFILEAGDFGRIGVAICSDFFDIERFVIYKGQIQHMIVISYNQDTRSYYFLAEAISRLVYCNVVICNTGYYGGSLVFAPYEKDYNRYIYKHEGGKLFTTQILKLPVDSLVKAQKSIDNVKGDFKSKPPGYQVKYKERKVITEKL